VTDNITLQDTDAELRRHVKNGYMRYKDFKPLTQGGEATLKTCRDENLGRTVVMKTLLPQLQNLEVYQKRFLREARVTSLIPHPATVPVYELSRDNEGNAYFTMKKLSGRDLCDILDSIAEGNEEIRNEYPLDALINVLIHVGQCLAFAHQRGVVHRDIKPANIMVGEFGDIMLLDWGLAKVWDMEDDDVVEQLARSGRQQIPGRLTGRGDVQGTPFYMSPEQARETGDIDHRTDVYNMGIILFEMLTGQSYMSGRNFREIKRKILEDPIRTPKENSGGSTISPELNAICIKALQKDPVDRYSTMTEFIDDLRAFLLGRPVSVYEPPVHEKVLQWRNEKLFSTTSVVSFLLGILGCLIVQSVF